MLTRRGQRNFASRTENDGYKRAAVSTTASACPTRRDADRISAKCTNGVLEIVIPKHEKVLPRKITVEA